MRLTRRVANLEQCAVDRGDERHRGPVVRYDPVTGMPLPGYVPGAQTGVTIWIPDNGRGGAADAEGAGR